MTRRILYFLASLAAMPLAAAELPPKASVADVIKASKNTEWRALDPANTLYMELPAGRVVIELAPAFAPKHADNLRALVRDGYFDGLAILRAQDNFVVQWGDPDEANPRPLKTARAKLDGEFTVPLKSVKAFTRLPASSACAWSPTRARRGRRPISKARSTSSRSSASTTACAASRARPWSSAWCASGWR
jgi:peptidylprolyl isomerase